MKRDFIYYRKLALQNLPKRCAICKKKKIKLEVHHKDGNIKNNILSNLQLLCNPCHEKIHKIRKKKKYPGKYAKGTKKIHKKK